MKKQKWLLATAALILVIGVVFGAMSSVAYADTVENATAYESVGLSVTSTSDADDRFTWTIGSSTTLKYDPQWNKQHTTNLIITNNNSSDNAVIVSFTASGFKVGTSSIFGDSVSGSLSITTDGDAKVTTNSIAKETIDNTIYHSGSYAVKLGADASMTLTYKGVKGTDAYTASLNSFTVTEVTSTTLTLEKPSDGRYEVQTLNQGEIVDEATSDDGSIEYATGDTVKLTAYPTNTDTHNFQYWTINDIPVSSANPYTTTLNANDRINAIFVSSGRKLVYTVGEVKHYSWSAAIAEGVKSGNPVIMSYKHEDGFTLPGTKDQADAIGETYGDYLSYDAETENLTYKVPIDCVFIIPYDDTFSTAYKNEEGDVGLSTTLAVGTSQYYMTVPAEATLEVDGTFVVNAKTYCFNYSFQGAVNGDFGKLVLGGTMKVNPGGKLYARGYIVDINHEDGHSFGQSQGKLYCDVGSETHILFQVLNHRGGRSTTKTLNEVLPTNVYSLQNIMLYVEYKSGASLFADYAIHFSVSSLYETTSVGSIPFISTANGLFVMENAVIGMDYDYKSDTLIANVKSGNVSVENIVLKMSDYSMDTKEMELPFPENLEIYIGTMDNKVHNDSPSAYASIKYPIKMMPGMNINIMGDGAIQIPTTGGLYLYDANDYDSAWSDGRYRYRLSNDLVERAGEIVPCTEDAQLNVWGTVINDGILLQSESADIAVVPKCESAVFDTSVNKESGEVVEHVGTYTDSSVKKVYDKWKGIAGLLAGRSTSATNYQSFTANDTGTYKAVKINDEDDNLYWSKYTVNVVCKDATNGEELLNKPVYLVDESLVIDEAFFQKYLGGKYVITACDTTSGTVTDSDADGNPNVNADESNMSKGWEYLTLSDLASSPTITLTVKPYDYRVIWNIPNDTDKNRADYVVAGKDSYTEWDNDNSVAFSAKITTEDGNGTAATGAPSYTETTSRYTISNIDKNLKVELDITTDAWLVTWNVTLNGESFYNDAFYVGNGSSYVFNIKEELKLTDDAWYIVNSDEDWSLSPADEPVATGYNGKEFFTLSSVTGAVTVNIDLTRYDCKVQLVNGSDTPGENGVVEPFYINFTDDDKVDISWKNISSDTARFIFNEVTSVSPAESLAVLNEYSDMLTVSNLNSSLVTATVTLKSFDYRVEVLEGNDTLSRQYIASGTNPDTYTFGSNVYFTNNPSKSGTATVTAANATVDAPASITITGVSSDVTVTVYTGTYTNIIRFVDRAGNVKHQSYADDSTTYNVSENDGKRYYISEATIVEGGGTLSAVPAESLTITNATGNPKIQVTLTEFSRKVTWNTVDGNHLYTNYLTAEELEKSLDVTFDATGYTDDSNRRHLAMIKQYSGVSGAKINNAEIVTATLTEGTTDATIDLELKPYVYKIEYLNGDTVVKTQYVDEFGGNVVNSTSVGYTAPDNKYLTAVEITSGVATIDGSGNTNVGDVADGWKKFTLTDISSDVTAMVDLAPYDYEVTWILKTSLNNVTTESKEAHYVTGSEDSVVLDEKYTISSVNANVAAVETSGIGSNVARISNISSDVEVVVDARDFLYSIDWAWVVLDSSGAQVDGDEWTQPIQESTPVTEEGYVTWKVGDHVTAPDGISYVITNVVAPKADYDNTNKTLMVKRNEENAKADNISVSITLEPALTNYTALWGDMSYRYYKNGAFYSWVEEEGNWVWKQIDQYAWTPISGGRLHTYADLMDPSKNTQYHVPNGSVMIVNPTNQKITATITIQMDNDTDLWKVAPTVTLNGEDGTTGVTTITVTLNAHETFLIRAVLEGTPMENLTDAPTGTCSVDIKPID